MILGWMAATLVCGHANVGCLPDRESFVGSLYYMPNCEGLHRSSVADSKWWNVALGYIKNSSNMPKLEGLCCTIIICTVLCTSNLVNGRIYPILH